MQKIIKPGMLVMTAETDCSCKHCRHYSTACIPNEPRERGICSKYAFPERSKSKTVIFITAGDDSRQCFKARRTFIFFMVRIAMELRKRNENEKVELQNMPVQVPQQQTSMA